MIKLIECKNNSQKKIQIKQTANVFEFVLYNHAVICSHEIDFSSLSDSESITLKYSNTYRKFIQYKNNFNSRDAKTFYENYFDIANDVSIIITKHSGDVAILSYNTIGDNLTEHEIILDDGNWLDVLQNHLPGYVESYSKKKSAKVKLMQHISPLDSISYLEKQVDILTSIVLLLIDDKKPTWLQEFSEMHISTSSVTDDLIEQQIQKLKLEKQHIRDLQLEYFNTVKNTKP